MLSLEKVSKSFNAQRVLDTISLQVTEGEIALFVGPSGVGKSTLLRVLCNLDTWEQGKITLDSKQLTSRDLIKDHLIGMVFQQFNLFPHLSVIENITLPLELVAKKTKPEAQEIALRLMSEYDLTGKEYASIQRLSGGQKQRLALARTLALQPKIICLDEPTSALDPLLTTHVAQNIQALARTNYITLIASHDTELIRQLDCTIYLMHAGKIIESAQSKQLVASPEAFPHIRSFMKGNKTTL